MALRVWLPLNGNLENQGLSGIKPTISSPIYTNGKIGQCLLLDRQIDTTLSFADWDYVTNNCSFGCWIKVSLTDLQTIANGKTFDSTNSTMGGTLLGKDSYGGLALRWKTNNLSSSKTITTVSLYGHIRNTNSNSQVTNSYVIPFDTWTHVMLIINRSAQTMSIYINGKLFNEKSIGGVTGSFSTGNFLICQSSWDSGNGVSSSGKFSLNDIRVYDNCLSPKEVKELAEGLCLHYKLAGPGQENLVTTMAAGGRTILVDKYTLNADFSQNLDTYGYFNVDPALELDKTYTLSFDVLNMPVNSRWSWKLWNNANYSFLVEGNGHYSYTFCPSAAKLPSDYSLTRFLFDDGGRTNPAGIVTFTNFKIEKGSIATPWCPHKNDPLYNAMGYNNNIEDDYSGYGHNGTKSGTITWDSDSPRYATSYKFGSTSTKIKATNFGMSGFANSYSFAWWQKNTSSGNMPWGFSDGNRLNLYHTTNLCWNTGDGGSNPFKDSSGTAIPSTRLCDSTWHHCAVTGNGSTTKLYIDGNYVGNATTYKPITGTQIYISGWDTSTSYTFSGSNISDFRIYATTLSDADILELYEVGGAIDSHYNSYAYEFIEE